MRLDESESEWAEYRDWLTESSFVAAPVWEIVRNVLNFLCGIRNFLLNSVFPWLKNVLLCCKLRKVAQILSFCTENPQRTVGEKYFLIAGLVAFGRKRRSWFPCGCLLCVKKKLKFWRKRLFRRRRENYFIADDSKIVTRDKGGKVEWNVIELRDWKKQKSVRKNGVIGESENILRHRLFLLPRGRLVLSVVHHLQLSLFAKGLNPSCSRGSWSSGADFRNRSRLLFTAPLMMDPATVGGKRP